MPTETRHDQRRLAVVKLRADLRYKRRLRLFANNADDVTERLIVEAVALLRELQNRLGG